jgi:two-component system cell cycle sensor histidine kinase/response regulator CckA
MSESKLGNTQSESAKHPGALIYVVDDEPMLLELATVILESEGYRIKTFRDPGLALQTFAAAQERPVVLITDYAMHTMNGMELIAQFRRLDPRQKILLVSGTVGEEIFRNAGARPDAFLAKPYLAEDLTRAVSQLLRRD